MKARHSEGMTTALDHSSYTKGALVTWRLLADSEGTRGAKGGLKQYIVRVELTTDGKFIVTKHWGKADGQRLSELASSRVATYSDFPNARARANMVAREKTDGKYWTDYHNTVELVPA